MKNLYQCLNESINDKSLNEAATNVSAKSSSSGLIVQLDLTHLEKDTIQTLFHDWNIDWSKLNKKDLEKLYNLVGSDLSFDEWVEANEFM